MSAKQDAHLNGSHDFIHDGDCTDDAPTTIMIMIITIFGSGVMLISNMSMVVLEVVISVAVSAMIITMVVMMTIMMIISAMSARSFSC